MPWKVQATELQEQLIQNMQDYGSLISVTIEFLHVFSEPEISLDLNQWKMVESCPRGHSRSKVAGTPYFKEAGTRIP